MGHILDGSTSLNGHYRTVGWVRCSDEYQLKLASIDDRRYIKRMKAIFRTFIDLREPVVFPLTDEARAIFIDYAGRWKREVNNVRGGPTAASSG